MRERERYKSCQLLIVKISFLKEWYGGNKLTQKLYKKYILTKIQ
jgi:hypothetical protein